MTVAQVRGLLEAGLSTEDIAGLLPCATGGTPDLEPCPELLATLGARLHGLDERIDTLAHSRQALRRYLDATAPAHSLTKTLGPSTFRGPADPSSL